MNRITRTTLAVASAAVAVAGLAACGSDEDGSSTTTSAMPSAQASAGASAGAQAPAMDPTAQLVGNGCADYAAAVPEGAGSISGMAKAPVATAAGNNPLLKTLVSAVSGKVNPQVNLVDTLNAGQFTVFAPTDDAFAKVPQKTLASVSKDPAMLTKVLTYHVLQGQIAPDKIAGSHTTLEGQKITVTGTGNNLMVGTSKVICGGVQTANATVYLIDGVLMPTS
jgi:uncharacterized surface protein with fasciclin (FAS1) repeats